MFVTMLLGMVVAVVVQAEPESVTGPLTSLGGYALGIAGVVLTSGVKWLTQKGDVEIGKVDTAVTKALRPVQPIVATALAFALPYLGQKFSMPVLSTLDPQTVVAAPIGVAVGISLREMLARIGGKVGVTPPPTR